MSEKVPCSECGKLILPMTADKTGGFCMPCGKAKDPKKYKGNNDGLFTAFLADNDEFIESTIRTFEKANGRLPEFGELPAQIRSNPKAGAKAKEFLAFNGWPKPTQASATAEPQQAAGSVLSYHLAFVQSDSPLTGRQTKFGGQPEWLEEPQWPISRSTGEKLTFVGQIELMDSCHPGLAGKMVYIFVNTSDEVDNTWDPNGGENAIVVQPGNNTCSWVTESSGPTMEHALHTDAARDKPCEFVVKMTPVHELVDDDEESLANNKVCGIPYWFQYEELPFDDAIFIAQLSDETVPFDVNFGSGMAYVFLSRDGGQGKMLSQC